MKKSISSSSARMKTAAKCTKQKIDWTAVVTVGIDIGNRFSHYCALDGAGTVVIAGRISTTADAFELEFAKVPRKTVAIEAGVHSPWISRLLCRLGHEVIVANPRKLRLIYENQHKNDRVDAEYLARVARLDRKPLGAVGIVASSDRHIWRFYARATRSGAAGSDSFTTSAPPSGPRALPCPRSPPMHSTSESETPFPRRCTMRCCH